MMNRAGSATPNRRFDSSLALLPLACFFHLLFLIATPVSSDSHLVNVLLADRLSSVTIERDGVSHRVASRASASLRVPPGDGFLAMNGRLWRGELIVERSDRGGLRVINRLALEDYLKGVVPSEMPAAWPLEALKAQAVAARSYALGRLRRRLTFADRVGAFELQATVSDQVYRGASAESDTSNRAVEETAGEILEFDGAPVTAYFHAACGGVAERPAEIWRNLATADERWVAASGVAFGNDPDSWCAGSPHQSWRLVLTRREVMTAIRRFAPLWSLERFEVHDRTLSGRVARFAATGRTSEGRRTTRLIDGQKFRMALGPNRMKSLLGDLFPDGDRFVFFGRGWGHGAGLCQWGARVRAEAGATYDAILRAYYPGARLVRETDAAAVPTSPPETVSFPEE